MRNILIIIASLALYSCQAEIPAVANQAIKEPEAATPSPTPKATQAVDCPTILPVLPLGKNRSEASIWDCLSGCGLNNIAMIYIYQKTRTHDSSEHGPIWATYVAFDSQQRDILVREEGDHELFAGGITAIPRSDGGMTNVAAQLDCNTMRINGSIFKFQNVSAYLSY